MELIERLGDEVVVMAARRFPTCGTFAEVASNREARESYLGIRRNDRPRHGEPFIGRNKDDLRAAFFDHELLFAIGCESVFNAPIRCENRVTWNGHARAVTS